VASVGWYYKTIINIVMRITSDKKVTVPSEQRWVILWHVRLMPIQLMD
jgi:hypothetical protein